MYPQNLTFERCRASLSADAQILAMACESLSSVTLSFALQPSLFGSAGTPPDSPVGWAGFDVHRDGDIVNLVEVCLPISILPSAKLIGFLKRVS